MTYKTIVVYIDEASRSEPLLSAARQIAEAEVAHLIGLHVIPDIQVYSAADAQMPAEIYESQRAANLEVAREAEAVFAKSFEGTGISTDWRGVEEKGQGIGDRVMEHALVADLVIAGQIDPDIESRRRVGTPERLLLAGRRPMLMIPYVGHKGFGRRIMVAWNGSAESSRATFDALPLLARAEEVTLLAIDAEGGPAAPASAEAMAESLGRHGISATVTHTNSGSIGVGAALLSRIADAGSDLLVMGGYGHSRLREFVFGGATRHILQQMTVPVLMSH